MHYVIIKDYIYEFVWDLWGFFGMIIDILSDQKNVFV